MALRTPLSVTPHLYMGDSTGRPLDKGVVYFGEQDKDPEFYPIDLFSDDALTKPLAQPVHTKGGYLYDKGDMVEPHAKEIIYSVKVLDSYGRKVFYKGAMMRNSWNDDVISQIGAAIIESQTAAVIAAEIAVQDAINNTAVEGGVLADTFVTVTANGTGSVARTQRDKNSDIPSIKDFANVADAQAAAISQGIKIFIPTGEHEYDLANVDMTLFWGYGQLKDATTGAIYKPKNGDFVTPEMFGVDSSKVIPASELKRVARYVSDNKLTLVWESGKTYRVSGHVYLESEHPLHIDWRSSGADKAKIVSVLDSNLKADSYDAFHFVGKSTSTTFKSPTGAYKCTATEKGKDIVNVVSSAGIEAGDLLHLKSTRLYEGEESRGLHTEGQLVKVVEVVNSNQVRIEGTVLVDIVDFSTVSGVVENVTSSSDINLGSSFSQLPDNWKNSRLIINNTAKYIYKQNSATNEVEINSAWGSGFAEVHVGDSWTVEVGVYYDVIKPNLCSIKNISVTRNLMDLQNESQGSAFILRNFTDPIIENNHVSKFAGIGFQLYACYGGQISHNNFSQLYNRGYGGGIVVDSCSNTHVYKNTSVASRRIVDVGGSFGFSFNIHVSHNTAWGGGLTTMAGAEFKPYGDRYNNCVTSHGGAVGTIFSNNVGYNVEVVVSLRGFDEFATNNYAYGACRYVVAVTGGRGSVIDGIYYKSGYSERGELNKPIEDMYNKPMYHGTELYYADNAPADHIRALVYLNYRGMVKGTECVVRNGYADIVSKAAIEILAWASVKPYLTFGNLSLTLNPVDGNGGALVLLNGDIQIGLDSFVDLGGNNINTDSYANDKGVYYYGVMDYRYAKVTAYAPSLMRVHEKSYLLTINNNSVVAIPANWNKFAWVTIQEALDATLDKTYQVNDMLIREKASYASINGEYYIPTNNLRIGSTKLTGTTGDDGMVTVSYIDGSFFIENRSGKLIHPLVKIV